MAEISVFVASKTFPEAKFHATDSRTGNHIIRLHKLWKEQVHIEQSNDFLINTKNNIAMYMKGIRYNKYTNRTLFHKYLHDNNIQNKRYYIAIQSAIAQIRKFFTSNKNKYRVLLDMCTEKHQCSLLIVRDEISQYKFYGFDPNVVVNNQHIVNFVKSFAPTVNKITMWSASCENLKGFCFKMTWRFIHAIMMENYDPVLNEKVIAEYYLKKKKPIVPYNPKPNEPYVSLIGYDSDALNRLTIYGVIEYKIKND